jgi:aspartyl-tRNA(Asn)/glutamyl-tRNA(Gln) amidotransferase subunit A
VDLDRPQPIRYRSFVTAAEVAQTVAVGTLSAQSLAEQAIERLQQAQGVLNPATLIDANRAIQRAAAIDERVAKGIDAGPLAGVPVVIKDIIDQAGRPTTCGSSFYSVVPERAAVVVDRLEAAGAVIVARTGLHEFAYGFSSENQWFGPVRNPWDPATSPGGSSGGSATAVAAGLVPIGIGTDTGGSVRVPAALTGTMGLKVTHGRIPTAGVFPLAPSLDTIGPIATNVADLALAYRVMAGVAAPPPGFSLTGLRLGVPIHWLEAGPTQTEVTTGFEAALDTLEALGVRVHPIEAPELLPWGMIQELAGAEAFHVHHEFLESGKVYGEEVAQRLRTASAVTASQYLDAQAWRSHLVEATADVFAKVDLLATPGVAALRKNIGVDTIDGQHYRPALSWFSALVNHMGCPAITLPLAGSTNPPVSIQLIAPWWREDRLLETAALGEGAGLVGFRPPPLYFG